MTTSIHIDTDQEVTTYGGESSGDCGPDYYGIQFDNLTIEISPKTALSLVKELTEHLKTNGHKL